MHRRSPAGSVKLREALNFLPGHFGAMLDRAEIERFTAAVLDGDVGPIGAVFLAHGNRVPLIRWEPVADDFPRPQLKFLLEHWNALRGDAAMPPRKAVDPVALKPALGFIMLLDAVDEGWDYIYRLYGSEITPHVVRDYTGMRTSELVMSGHTYITHFYLACYRAVRLRRAPLYTENTPPPSIAVKVWHRLILPFADQAGEPDHFLVGNVPGPWRSTSTQPA